jgi:hypothetical protein
METVAAMSDAGDAAWESAVELQVQRAQQQRQLCGMRKKAHIALALLDDLEVLPINRFEGDMPQGDLR